MFPRHHPGKKIGDEIGSEIQMELVLTEALKFPRKSKRSACNVSYCTKVALEWVTEQAREAADGWARLEKLL
jgi:hypothetical protein